MTASEYTSLVLEVKKEAAIPRAIDEASAYEVAQLVSGSFIYSLQDALKGNGFDVATAAEHLEAMYDSGNHYGLVYFVFILANAAHLVVPLPFSEMSANDALVPLLSAAIIEDWLDSDFTDEVGEYE